MINLVDASLGALAGQILATIIKYLRLTLKARKRRTISKHREIARNTKSTSDWLLSYYKECSTDDDLHNCRIGKFERKIAFLTRNEWCTNHKVDFKNKLSDQIIVLSDGINDFNIDYNIIRKREESGVVMFPDGPTLYLDDIECDTSNILRKLHLKEGTYYQAYSNISMLEDETFRAIEKGKSKKSTPFRNRYISSIENVSRLTVKPFGLGCAVLMALKSESSFDLIIHKRSNDIGTYPNARAVVPNFGMEPIVNNQHNKINGNDLLLYNFLKEYLEELFNYEELINQAISKKVNPFWFYENSREAKNILNAIDRNTFEFVFLGFGFDCLNGVPILSFLAVVNDDEVINDIKNAESNWEGTIEIINMCEDLRDLEDWLKENDYHPGASFTISRAQTYIESEYS